MNYKQAVEAALQGNADAFSALYESTQNNMYYLALKYMKNPDMMVWKNGFVKNTRSKSLCTEFIMRFREN